MNVLCNVDVLQSAFGDKLHRAFQQQFTGPIGIQDEFSTALLKKLPFNVPQQSLVENGEIGLCHLGVSMEGNMLITLDTERAAIRDAINNVLFKDMVIEEAKKKGIFFASLIGLAMKRSCKDFIDMFEAIHHTGVITVFDTNYRSYVMEHCYPQQNNRKAAEVMSEIIPNTDVLVAGNEDIFALEPEKERSIERAKAEFFTMAPDLHSAFLKQVKMGLTGEMRTDLGSI